MGRFGCKGSELELAGLGLQADAAALGVTPKEFTLLRMMTEKPGIICERDEIARAVWPEYEGQVADYQIDNLVARVRHKVERRARAGVRIIAVKKRGYRLVLSDQR